MAGCLAGTLLGLEAGVLTLGLVPVCFTSAEPLRDEPRDATGAAVGEPEAIGIEPSVGETVEVLGIVYFPLLPLWELGLPLLGSSHSSPSAASPRSCLPP